MYIVELTISPRARVAFVESMFCKRSDVTPYGECLCPCTANVFWKFLFFPHSPNYSLIFFHTPLFFPHFFHTFPHFFHTFSTYHEKNIEIAENSLESVSREPHLYWMMNIWVGTMPLHVGSHSRWTCGCLGLDIQLREALLKLCRSRGGPYCISWSSTWR